MRDLTQRMILGVLLVCSLCSSNILAQERKSQAEISPSPTDTISGSYEGVLSGESLGDLDVKLEIKSEGENISGTIRVPFGSFQIKSGTFNGNQLSIKFQALDNDISISTRYQNGRLTGTYTIEDETGKVELKRIDPRAPPLNALTNLTAGQWREDLQYLAKGLAERHKNAFHHVKREEFERAVKELDARIPSLQYDQIIVEMSRIAALIGDGHTRLRFPEVFHRYPFTLYWFGSELRVIKTSARYERALGARVVRIGRTNIAEIDARVKDLIAQDENEWLILKLTPDYIVSPEVLHSLNILPEIGSAPFSFLDDEGRRFKLNLLPVSLTAKLDWLSLPKHLPLYLQKPDEQFWFTFLPESRSVYVNFKGYDGFSQNAQRLFQFIDEHQAQHLIIDLRQNGGGDFTLVRKYLLPGLKQRTVINQTRHLFVITGRRTFSAAMSNATDFRNQTKAIIVGEPAGERPNSYQEVRALVLPNSLLTVSYSVKYYKFLDEDAPALIPDKRIDPDWRSYKAGRDSALEWILSYVSEAKASQNPDLKQSHK